MNGKPREDKRLIMFEEVCKKNRQLGWETKKEFAKMGKVYRLTDEEIANLSFNREFYYGDDNQYIFTLRGGDRV